MGACCYGQACYDQDEASCLDAGGAYYPGETCDGFECPELVSACCWGDGHCSDLTPSECLAFGGSPEPAGRCADLPGLGLDCPQTEPPRACCLPDGRCVEYSIGHCSALGGSSAPVDVLCDGWDCEQAVCRKNRPEPVGARWSADEHEIAPFGPHKDANTGRWDMLSHYGIRASKDGLDQRRESPCRYHYAYPRKRPDGLGEYVMCGAPSEGGDEDIGIPTKRRTTSSGTFVWVCGNGLHGQHMRGSGRSMLLR